MRDGADGAREGCCASRWLRADARPLPHTESREKGKRTSGRVREASREQEATRPRLVAQTRWS